MDHISNGRFVLGLGLGYRRTELEAVGASRRERTSRFEESLRLMKLLWAGEETNFEGHYWQVHNARMAITPVQKPHPPVWIAAQSSGAARRAASMGDACLLGPMPSWNDVQLLARVYWEALEEQSRVSSGLLAANRSIAISMERDTAIREAKATAEGKASLYGRWDMQEPTTVNLGGSAGRDLSDWAIVASPEDCSETISRCYHEQGLRHLGLGFLNLPREHLARLEYLQFISEELLPRLPQESTRPQGSN